MGMAFEQQLHYTQRRRFAHITHIALISYSQHQDARPFEAFAMFIERPRHLVYNKLRHASVHFARQINETRSIVERTQLPGEVQWIDGDAVSAKTRPGIERHEPIRLGGCRLDHFPTISSQHIPHPPTFVLPPHMSLPSHLL